MLTAARQMRFEFQSRVVDFLPTALGSVDTAVDWALSHWYWIFFFFVIGGGSAVASALRWCCRTVKKVFRTMVLVPRAAMLGEARRKEERQKAELDAAHSAGCPCGEDCAGREKCEEHHRDCNCDHYDSVCVCQDTDLCDCECRCDCRECDGYKRQVPLRRAPHSAATVRDDTAGSSVPSPTGQKSLPSSWSAVRQEFLLVAEHYVAFECDPRELVRLPALTDVTFAPTATFVEAFYEANQLLTEAMPDDTVAAGKFVDAARRAINSWRLAREAAERVRDARMDEEERNLLRRITGSFRLADEAASPQEGAHALGHAARMMRDLDERGEKTRHWRLPATARLELESWSKPELTAGSGGAGVDPAPVDHREGR